MQARGLTSLLLFVAMLSFALWLAGRSTRPRQYERKALRTGTHLTLVFIAPTSVRSQETSRIVGEARDAVATIAAARGESFWTVGISFHWDVHAGLEVLSQFGEFDEVIVGRNWLNTGLRRYVWDDVDGKTGKPQILLTREYIELVSEPRAALEFGPHEVLLRLVGQRAFEDWRDSHFALQ